MPVDLPTMRPPAASQPRTPRVVTGRTVLVALLLFFGVIFGVNMVMMTLAIRTMPGVEVKSTYEASQQFNRKLDAIAEQDARGWQVEIASAALTKERMLGITVRDKAGAALTGLEVLARLERPTDDKLDRKVVLVEQGGGRYGVALPDLARGQWQLTIEIRQGGARQFLAQRRIELRE